MKTRDKIDNMILDHGGPYDGGDGLTIGCFYAIDSIKHFGRAQTGANISVAMHSLQTAMIGSIWFKWQLAKGYSWPITQTEFITLCTLHDTSEALVGDVWRPVKTKEMEDQEKKVQTQIMNFLNLGIDVDINTKAEMKKVDNAAQFCELVHYLEISPGHLVFSSIGAAQARIMVTSSMVEFCLNSLGLGKHPVAIRLLSDADTLLSHTEG